MLVKRMYLILIVTVLTFLYFDCGGNENKNPNQNQDQNMGAQTTTNALPEGDPSDGQKYFSQTCSACHGMDAKGLPKLGKDLTTSKFVEEKTDAQFLDFLKQGRLATDSLNTTGVAMPPKGGNPSLNDQQLMDIISYVRQIHE